MSISNIEEDQLAACKAALSSLPIKHSRRIAKQIDYVERRKQNAQKVDKKLAVLLQETEAMIAQMFALKHQIPRVEFPEALPVSAKLDVIAEALKQSQVLVVAGETGSGKTTQIPKICLQQGFGLRGKIGNTQPRRIAARTVASRIAEELNVELGHLVGYQVRFTDHCSDSTIIKLMTDGILLAEIQKDPLLLDYEVLIIDEAHERSLNIDFILGYLRQLLPRRPDLKLIITSATIDVDRFSQHFNGAPVIEVSGRTYPVDIRYSPWENIAEDPVQAIVTVLEDIQTQSKGLGGDVLVFLSGERDIREVSLAIKKAQLRGFDVLPLYARLSLAEQNKIFQSHSGRRVILATNVAETSITVPGIRYVIDTGVARISRYSLRTKVQRLPIEPVSQASANQRAGRCGRVAEGVCYRLYSEEDFNARVKFTEPELLRTNLAAVVLQMLHLNMGKVEDFPFVDQPDSRLINDGYKLLEELQAVDSGGKITKAGRDLHRLSLDPRFARMLFEAARQACVNEVLIIVTGLTIQDPRERPADKKQAADEMHRRFLDDKSDFLGYVNLWHYVEEQRQNQSQNQWRKQCKKEHLNFLRLKEWRELHYQIKLQLKQLGLRLNEQPASEDQVHRALLVGLLSNTGQLDEREKDPSRLFLGTRSRRFSIFPGSGLRKKKYKWIVAADFIETSQLFAHCVAKIDPLWVVDAAGHLIKKQYMEPHYDSKAGCVKAYVKMSLWGLVLSEKTQVDYGKIDPVVSREIFIRSAFVEHRYRGKGAFYKNNLRCMDDIGQLEAKARRRDILVGDEQIFTFYHDRIPENVVNLAGFEHWRKTIEKEKPQYLFLNKEDLMLHAAANISIDQFPDSIKNGDLVLPVRYEFEPTKTNDGMNVMIPVDLLHQVDGDQLQWLVPGLLHEKCVAMVKALPKQKRKCLVPVPSFVEKALLRIAVGEKPLEEALAEALRQLSNVEISEEDWSLDKLEAYYSANIVLLDDRNKIIDQSRDLSELKAKYRARVQTSLQSMGNHVERDEVLRWDFDRLPDTVELKRGAVTVKAFPAIVPADTLRSVAIRLQDNPKDAQAISLKGLCVLAANEMAQTAKYVRKDCLRGKDLGLSMVELGRREDVANDILLAGIRRACFHDVSQRVDDKESFLACVNTGKANVVEYANDCEKVLVESLMRVIAVRKKIKSSKNALALALAYGDIQAQLGGLFYPGFLFETPWQWLQQYPRYLDAILARIDKAPQKPQADTLAMTCVNKLWQKHIDRLATAGHSDYVFNTAWQQYRWMLEELRVSMFAQSLKTLIPVSEKRLKKHWEQL